MEAMEFVKERERPFASARVINIGAGAARGGGPRGDRGAGAAGGGPHSGMRRLGATSTYDDREVAVKRLSAETRQGREFQNEATMPINESLNKINKILFSTSSPPTMHCCTFEP